MTKKVNKRAGDAQGTYVYYEHVHSDFVFSLFLSCLFFFFEAVTAKKGKAKGVKGKVAKAATKKTKKLDQNSLDMEMDKVCSNPE